MVVRIQITFKSIQTPETEEFEQGMGMQRESSYSDQTSLHHRLNSSQVQKNLERFGNLRDFYCLQDHMTSNNKMGKDKAKDKEQHNGETTASSETINSPWDTCQDAHQSNRDLS